MNYDDVIRSRVAYLADNWDLMIVFMGPKNDEHGLLGHTKTRCLIWTAAAVTYELNRVADRTGYPDTFDFDLARDLVIRDDLPHFQAVHRRQGFGAIKAVDEYEHFGHEHDQMFTEVRKLSPFYDSSRKEQGAQLYAMPNVHDAIAKVKEERAQLVIVCRSTGTSATWTVYVRNGICTRKPSKELRRMYGPQYPGWGRPIVEIRDPPMVTNSVWYEYEALYQEHMDLPCPAEGVCVEAIREERRLARYG